MSMSHFQAFPASRPLWRSLMTSDEAVAGFGEGVAFPFRDR